MKTLLFVCVALIAGFVFGAVTRIQRPNEYHYHYEQTPPIQSPFPPTWTPTIICGTSAARSQI